jgi:hypothetical protein
VDGDAALLEDARQLLADVRVLEWDDAVRELDEGHLGAEVAVHARPLHADGAGTHDGDPAGNVAAGQRLVAGDHQAAVGLQPRQRSRRAAGRHDEVLGARLDVARLAAGHPHAGRSGERPIASEHGDLVLLHQELDAADVLVDHRIATLGEGSVVEPDPVVAREAELGALLRDPVQQIRSLEQCLRRDAAPIQARATQLVSLHEPDAQAKLRGADRADIAHAAAQDEEVEALRIGHQPAATGASASSGRPSCSPSNRRHPSGTGMGREAA